MGRLLGGAGLLLLGLIMFAGFLGSDAEASSAATFLAIAISAVLPALGGIALIRSHFRGKGRIADRKAELRQQTLEAEVLRLAGKYGGKLTIVEAVSELAITPEGAKEALDALARRGLADFEVTESGVIVYAFHDLQRLGEKSQSKGILS